MLESNNPDIDVDALMARVEREVLRRQFGAPVAGKEALASIDVGAIEGLLSTAAQRANPRNRWPERLNFFPFNLKPVQRFGLRTLAWVFRDQQAYNAALLAALREVVGVNVRLHATIRELDSRVRALEHRE